MSVELNPKSKIESRLGLRSGGSVQKFFTETCAKHMDKYVPYREGDLSRYRLEQDAVVYEQLYAKYQYYGIRRDGTRAINEDNRDRSKHPLASSYWNEKMVSAEKQDIVKEVQDFVKRGG